MTHSLFKQFGIVLLLTVMGFTGDAMAAPPPEAYGRLPQMDDVSISPDGKHIAMIRTYEGRNLVMIHRLGAGKDEDPTALAPGDAKVRGIRWANNERLLVTLSITHQTRADRYNRMFEFVRILSMHISEKEEVYLFQGNAFKWAVNSGRILSVLPDDPDHVLIAQINPFQGLKFGRAIDSNIEGMNEDEDPPLNVYKVNVSTGKEKQVQRGNEETGDWIVDSSGEVRMRIDYKKGGDAMRVYANENGGRLKKVEGINEAEDGKGLSAFWGFGDASDMVYVTARHDSDRLGLYRLDLKTGTIADKVFLHDQVDLGSVLIDRYTDKIVGVTFTEHLPETVYFDEKMAKLQSSLSGAFPKYSVSIVSSSRDGLHHILLLQNAREPGVYMYFDAAKRQAAELGARYPELKPDDLGEVRAISYEARDGLTIPAYLTLPPGQEAKNLPLVLLPHGGPAARDTQSFDWMAQFYAGRGYAVLQPNYRGSSGYGSKFRKAGYGEFGQKMQHDLTDGVKHVIAQGIADPDRVCIVGASYGGYAALAGAAFTPDLYACAVSVAGIADLATFLGSVVRASGFDRGAFGVQYWERWIGQRASDAKHIEAISPVNHAAAFRAPVLLLHGKDDTVVQYMQSTMMADALKKAGKPHKLVTLEGEDHWLSQADSRIRLLTEAETFLAQHLGK